MVWHGTYCMEGISPSEPCQPSDTCCSGSWLYTVDWIEISHQKVPDTCIVLCNTTEFCSCNKSFVCANSDTETCLESCIVHFPTEPACSTRVDVLRRATCLPYSPFLQMKIGVRLLSWIQKERQNYMSSFCLALISGRIFHNGTYCAGLDESCVSAQIELYGHSDKRMRWHEWGKTTEQTTGHKVKKLIRSIADGLEA